MKSQNLILISYMMICMGFSPQTRAVVPAPDGGYPGENTAEGDDALFNLSTGIDNTALGFQALYGNTTGSGNTAIGDHALFVNTAGNNNTASGHLALGFNISGSGNTANGFEALYGNNTGDSNTAIGVDALYSNNTGSENTAIGNFALFNNTTGIGNVADGVAALQQNTTGNANTAIGDGTLVGNTTGRFNTANGGNALQRNTVGNNNTAVGESALFTNTTGSNNIAVGQNAGSDLTVGDNNIDIGYNVVGLAGESNTIRIGDTNITKTIIRGISGATVANGVAVRVNANGRLGTAPSSVRFKRDIKSMGKASEAIFALNPITFRYKEELDPEGVPQFGLVAEEVEKINPDLVVRDEQGKVNSVRYEQVNAMLLNEFLKEHRKVQKLEAALEAVNARLKEQDAKILKVSEQIELSQPLPRTASHNY
jgi:Chaperone of endosialidase